MPDKILGIPVREAITILIMAFGIGVAWATSQKDIENIRDKYKSLGEHFREFRKEYREDMKFLRWHIRRNKNENRR